MNYHSATPKEKLLDYLKTIDRYYHEGKLAPLQQTLEGKLSVWDFCPSSGICDNILNMIRMRIRYVFTDSVVSLVGLKVDPFSISPRYPVAGEAEYKGNVYKWFDDVKTNSKPRHQARAELLKKVIKLVEDHYTHGLEELL